MYPRQQRSGVGNRFRSRDAVEGKLLCGIAEVHLIEHAVAIVLCHRCPARRPEFVALSGEAFEVCLVRDVVSTEAACLLPESECFITFLLAELLSAVYHPAQQQLHAVGIVYHWEYAGRLQVFFSVDAVYIYVALCSPLREWHSEVFH